MFVPTFSLNTTHQRMAYCWEGAVHKRQRHTAEDARRAKEFVFVAHGMNLESVSQFKYLGRMTTSTDVDFLALYKNLVKACKCWAQISQVLRQEGASAKVSAMFYKVVLQVVLLYGSET